LNFFQLFADLSRYAGNASKSEVFGDAAGFRSFEALDLAFLLSDIPGIFCFSLNRI